MLADNDNNYMFGISDCDSNCDTELDACNLLVDCGATAHIICDRSKFINYDKKL